MSNFNLNEHILQFAEKEREQGRIPAIKEYINKYHQSLGKLQRANNLTPKDNFSAIFIKVCKTNNIDFIKQRNFEWDEYFGDNNNNSGSNNSSNNNNSSNSSQIVLGQKRNITNISKEETSTSATITSKFVFMTSGGDFSCETVEKWKLNIQNGQEVEQCITTKLMEFRQRSLSLAQANQKMNPIQVLSLNFVFFISSKRSKSITRSLPARWHQAIIDDLTPPPKPELTSTVSQWLSRLSTLSTPMAMKKQCVVFLNEAIAKNDDDLFQIAEFLFKYTPKAFKWSMRNMVEDTFVKNSIADIIETFVNDYNNDSPLKYEWSNKKLSSSPLKPDYTLSCETSSNDGDYLNLFAVEIKAPGRNRTSTDFQKTGFILKDMINKLVKIGLDEPLVCGLVVDGYDSYIYMMKPQHEAIYPLFETAFFSLPRAPADIPAISSIIVAIKQLVDLLGSTISQINDLQDGKVSSKGSFVRESFDYGKVKTTSSPP